MNAAPSIPRKVIVPLIGSTSVGDPPQFVTSVPAEFHASPVFSTAPAAARSSFELVAIGFDSSNRKIGEELHIKKATVKSHITIILMSLRVTDRTQAVVEALKRGLQPL